MRVSRCVCSEKEMKIAVKKCRLELSVIIIVCHTREHLSLIVFDFFLFLNRLYYTHSWYVLYTIYKNMMREWEKFARWKRGKERKSPCTYTIHMGMRKSKTFFFIQAIYRQWHLRSLQFIPWICGLRLWWKFLSWLSHSIIESERIMLWFYYSLFCVFWSACLVFSRTLLLILFQITLKLFIISSLIELLLFWKLHAALYFFGIFMYNWRQRVIHKKAHNLKKLIKYLSHSFCS